MRSKLLVVWNKWKIITEKFGNIMSRIILAILYLTLFSLIGVPMRLFSDKLNIRKKKSSYWLDVKDKVPKNLEEARRQG